MSLMYAQMGMKVLGSISSYMQQQTEYKISSMMQEHNNAMSALSTAMNLNANTSNVASLRDAAVRAKQAIEIQSMQDSASAEVSAAAAGVTGGSVANTMRQLVRSRLSAKHTADRNYSSQKYAMQDERRQIKLAGAMQKDFSVISRPSTASTLLGLGATLLDTYDSYQPEGEKTSQAMSRWWE